MAIKYKRRNTRTQQSQKKYLLNNQIRFPKIRVIDNEGENLGVIETREALKIARERELDLVVISEKANPPVAKILEYSKFLYEEKKKQQGASKASKSEIKEFIFGPSIGESDLMKRVERTREFLEEGNKVRFTVRLRGRERAFPEIGIQKLNTAVKELQEDARIESEPKLKGNLISVTFIKK